jgi:hypothetical protein
MIVTNAAKRGAPMAAGPIDLRNFSLYHDPNETWLARYAVQEAARGRRLEDVLNDEMVLRRCDAVARGHLLDEPEAVRAICASALELLRRQMDGGARQRPPAAPPA